MMIVGHDYATHGTVAGNCRSGELAGRRNTLERSTAASRSADITEPMSPVSGCPTIGRFAVKPTPPISTWMNLASAGHCGATLIA